MYTEEDLASAVSVGIFSEEAVAAFRQHVAGHSQAPLADEEHFRLLSGFNDIFVVIASSLLLLAVGWIAATLSPWCGSAAVAGTAWGLAEVFTRQRRMALPSIVLLMAFVGGVGTTVMVLLADVLGKDILLVLASACAAAGAWLHWRRFRVPITVAAGTAALIACVAALLLSAFPALREGLNVIVFVAGLACFTLAMRWDAADRERRTRRADVAFWLHLLAAPLLVHPAFQQLGQQAGAAQALLVLALYALIAAVSLCIDRRALMVSALVYVLYAFNGLLEQYGVVSLGFAITALLIGGALLMLSAFWHRCREVVLQKVPPAWQEKLPPLQ